MPEEVSIPEEVAHEQGRIDADRATGARFLVWASLLLAVLAIVALGLSSRRPTTPTVTPGQKSPGAATVAFNDLTAGLHALPIAHVKAANRQADARG